jgi:hypothetical protein
MYTRLASAIVNDIYAGLSGLHHNISLTDSLVFAGGFTAMAIIGTFPLAILALKNK